jgi:hypothetical protein
MAQVKSGHKLVIVSIYSNVRAKVDATITHRVVFTGDPKPKLTWYINNAEVKTGVDDIVITTDARTSTLVIKKFNPNKHIGEIICKAGQFV